MSVSTHRFVVDRLEGDRAVVDGLGSIPRALLPERLREGDVLEVVREGSRVLLTLDDQTRALLEATVVELRVGLTLAVDPPEGDIEL